MSFPDWLGIWAFWMKFFDYHPGVLMHPGNMKKSKNNA